MRVTDCFQKFVCYLYDFTTSFSFEVHTRIDNFSKLVLQAGEYSSGSGIELVQDTNNQVTKYHPALRKKEGNKNLINEQDDEMAFATFIASELRRVKDERTKSYIKYRMHCILFEEQYGNMGSYAWDSHTDGVSYPSHMEPNADGSSSSSHALNT